jgi:putative ABC transport system permease protein
VLLEGLIIGVTGALIGAAGGLLATTDFSGHLPTRVVYLAAIAALLGTLLTSTAALAPASLILRLPAAQALAEE